MTIKAKRSKAPVGESACSVVMVMQADLGLRREEIMAYVRSVVEVVIQLKRLPGGKRIVSEIYFPHGR